jgi:hypothetical protein
MIKEFILKQSFEKKIQLLESAFDEGFGMFWQVAEILLEAPCGEGGGLPTETIDKVFKNKLKEKK